MTLDKTSCSTSWVGGGFQLRRQHEITHKIEDLEHVFQVGRLLDQHDLPTSDWVGNSASLQIIKSVILPSKKYKKSYGFTASPCLYWTILLDFVYHFRSTSFNLNLSNNIHVQ